LGEKIKIANNLGAAREVERSVLREVASKGYDEEISFAIKLALEEGLNNAIKHGNGYDPSRTVEVHFDIDAERAVIRIIDEGCGFAPETIPDPTTDENLEKPCGRGIMLMRAYMDEVSYNEKGNEVCMVKRNT
jgi:serine/threonine-protein kinase RsbW